MYAKRLSCRTWYTLCRGSFVCEIFYKLNYNTYNILKRVLKLNVASESLLPARA